MSQEATSSKQQQQQQQQQIGRACNLCRLSHTACDSSRPCRRCVAIGKAHMCADVEMRKRGRPRKSGSGEKVRSSKSSKTSSAPAPAALANNGDMLLELSDNSGGGKASALDSEWHSAAKRPRREDGFQIRMPSTQPFDPFDPFRVSHVAAAATAGATASMVSVSERISNISSSFFGAAESAASLTTTVPRGAFTSSFSFSSAALSASMAASTTSSQATAQSMGLSAMSSSSASLDLSSSSSSSSSAPSSPCSLPSSPSSSSFDSSSQSLLGSLGASLLRGGAAASGAGERKRDDVLEGILSLVLEELREVKQHNREMRKQLDKVVKRQNKTEQRLLQLNPSATASTPSPSSCFSPPAAVSTTTSTIASAASASFRAHTAISGQKNWGPPESTLSMTALSDILNRMPFLLDYSVSPSSFVVNDPRKPFYALRVISQYIGEDTSPPIFIFVNNVFAELSGFALNELLGRNVNKVTYVDEQAKKEMLSKLFQSAPQTISEPFALPVLMRRKDGGVLRCECRHQAFYNELGYIRWCVTVVDSYTELEMRSEDFPLEWVPPIAWGQPKPGLVPGAASSSSPVSSSPSTASTCTTPLNSDNTPRAHPGYAPYNPPQSMFAGHTQHDRVAPPPQAVHHHAHPPQQQQQQHHQPANAGPQAYAPPSSAGVPAPSPLFSGAEERIDLQELLLQLIPASPSVPSYGAPATPSLSLSSSSSGLPFPGQFSTPQQQQQHQPPTPGSAGGDYSWLKDLHQTPPTQSASTSSWFDNDSAS